MNKVLRLLESKYGDIQNLVRKENCRVVESDRLTNSLLKDLFHHEVCGIHIKNFYSKAECARMSSHILQDEGKISNWSISHTENPQSKTNVNTTGLPFNVAKSNNNLEEYFASAIGYMEQYRKRYDIGSNSVDVETELLSPVDKLRLVLDEVYEDGCKLNKSKDKQSYVGGIARITYADSSKQDSTNKNGFIHCDDLHIMSNKLGLFSANIYLQMPPLGCGGHLRIYPISYTSRYEFYTNAITLSATITDDIRAQEMLHAKLPTPLEVYPEAGDLVLICVQRPHCVVTPIYGTVDRVSFQSFIQYEKNKPLSLEN